MVGINHARMIIRATNQHSPSRVDIMGFGYKSCVASGSSPYHSVDHFWEWFEGYHHLWVLAMSRSPSQIQLGCSKFAGGSAMAQVETRDILNAIADLIESCVSVVNPTGYSWNQY